MIVETIVNEKLSIWFDQIHQFQNYLAKIIQAALARDVARKARKCKTKRSNRVKWSSWEVG